MTLTEVAPLRKSGIGLLGDVEWGTHFCQFYHTKEDLADILVPYFKAGLENNEFCMWITSEPLSTEEATRRLKAAVPDLDRYVENGQIEIISYKDWYVKDGLFDQKRVLRGWVDKLNEALERGFDGLRLTGNTFWLEKKDWKGFTDYEEAVNNVIGGYRMIAICTYSLDKCGASEIIDVVNNHQFALIKRQNTWEMMQSAQLKKAEEKLAWHSSFPEGKPHPVTKALSFVVIAAGIAVIMGWIFHIGVLTSLSRGWVSMKFDTAVCFILSGIILFALARAKEGKHETVKLTLSIGTLTMGLLMGTLFFSSLLGLHTGLEELFIKDTTFDTMSLVPGRPSMPTMINFLLISVVSILGILNTSKVFRRLKIFGIVVGMIGASAVTGYLINRPLLYYYIPGVNTAMACNTAILFILLSAGFICLSD